MSCSKKMQKRPSATEPNPDNWRQEEQPEEAGQFRRATDDQMKARVVKKACRMSCGKARSKQCETVQVKCPDNKPSLGQDKGQEKGGQNGRGC